MSSPVENRKHSSPVMSVIKQKWDKSYKFIDKNIKTFREAFQEFLRPRIAWVLIWRRVFLFIFSIFFIGMIALRHESEVLSLEILAALPTIFSLFFWFWIFWLRFSTLDFSESLLLLKWNQSTALCLQFNVGLRVVMSRTSSIET